MSYTPTEWESTDVVTATRLNALEQAVGDLNMSYTPNVWQNGDILTADKMNALEQAVASGGGGDSGVLSEIFPICAKVNFVVSGVEEGHFPTFTDVGTSTGELLVEYDEYGWHFSPDEFTVTNGTFEYYLITPYADPELDYDKSSWDVSVSGGAELGEDGEYAWVMVSGDCTITATKR